MPNGTNCGPEAPWWDLHEGARERACASVAYVTMPPTRQVFVQRFVDTSYLYTAASIRARFVVPGPGGFELEDLHPRSGTAFIVHMGNAFHFVTNRHVLDWNCRQAMDADLRPGARLQSVEVRGFTQPEDLSQAPIPWTYSQGASSISLRLTHRLILRSSVPRRVPFPPRSLLAGPDSTSSNQTCWQRNPNLTC